MPNTAQNSNSDEIVTISERSDISLPTSITEDRNSDEIPGLLSFANEMLIEIAKKCNWSGLQLMTQVNKQMHQVFSADTLWKFVFKSYFPSRIDVQENFKQEFFIAYKKQIELEINFKHQDKWTYKGPLSTLSPAFRDDDYYMLIAISVHPMALELASERIKNSYPHVDLAISINGLALQHAGEIPRHNPTMIMKAVSQHALAARYIGEHVEKTREWIITLLHHKCRLIDLGLKICDDKELMLIAIKNNPANFYFASTRLKDDYDVIVTAVAYDGKNLFYAGPNARDNKMIALTALRSTLLARLYISSRLHNDPEIIAIIKTNSYIERIALCDEFLAKHSRTIKLSDSKYYFNKRPSDAKEHCSKRAVVEEDAISPSPAHSLPR